MPDEPKPWGKIALGVRLEKQTDSHFVIALTNFLMQKGLRKGDAVLLERGKVAHVSANCIIRRFLTDTTCDTLWILDSDADGFEPDFLKQFREYEPGWAYDGLQAFHTRRGWPPEAIWMERSGDTFINNMITGDLTADVGAIGTHCAMFRREVFERIYQAHGQGIELDKFEWFTYPRHANKSDEITLSLEATDLGFRLGATTAVKIGHLSTVVSSWQGYQDFLNLSGVRARTEEFYSLCELVAGFTGESREAVMLKAFQGGENVQAAWERCKPKSAGQVRQFYGLPDNGYLYDLINWNTSAFYHQIVEPLRAVQGEDVLVVGAGLGGEVERLLDGNHVTVFEFPGVLADFLKYRFSERGGWWILVNEKLYNALNLTRPAFDRAVMVDVIEHIHPDEFDETMDAVAKALRPGGVLYCHNNFGQQDLYPMHYDHSERFAVWLMRHNFEKVSDYEYAKTASEGPVHKPAAKSKTTRRRRARSERGRSRVPAA